MIGVMLSAVLAAGLFTQVAPPQGTEEARPITFALHGYDSQRNTVAQPVLSRDEDGGDVAHVRFTSPFKSPGVCIIYEVLRRDDEIARALLERFPVKANEVIDREENFVDDGTLSANSVTRETPGMYTLVAACKADSDAHGQDVQFSQFYRVTIPGPTS